MWIDTHVHLNDDRLSGQADQVVARARQAGVGRMVNAAYDLDSSRLGLAQAQRYAEVYTAVGIHPHQSKDYNDQVEKELRELASYHKVVAYGEIGLDYHYDNAPRDLQKEVFIRQLHLAHELGLPVIIHNRDSYGDMLEILKEHLPPEGAIMHCFSGSVEYMYQCVELGLMISFAGPITFKNARRLPEVVEKTPLDQLLVETDCPYLSPEPFRGRTNEPKNVVHVAQKMAEIRGMSLASLKESLRENTQRFFPKLFENLGPEVSL